MYFPANFVLPFIYLTTESNNAMLCSRTSHPATAAGDHCSGFVLFCVVLFCVTGGQCFGVKTHQRKARLLTD